MSLSGSASRARRGRKRATGTIDMDEEAEAEEEGAVVVVVVEPSPDIHQLFCFYNKLYFDDALGACIVRWSSPRMTRFGIAMEFDLGTC